MIYSDGHVGTTLWLELKVNKRQLAVVDRAWDWKSGGLGPASDFAVWLWKSSFLSLGLSLLTYRTGWSRWFPAPMSFMSWHLWAFQWGHPVCRKLTLGVLEAWFVRFSIYVSDPGWCRWKDLSVSISKARRKSVELGFSFMLLWILC